VTVKACGNTIQLWDWVPQPPYLTLAATSSVPVTGVQATSIAWSPLGSKLAASFTDGTITIFDTELNVIAGKPLAFDPNSVHMVGFAAEDALISSFVDNENEPVCGWPDDPRYCKGLRYWSFEPSPSPPLSGHAKPWEWNAGLAWNPREDGAKNREQGARARAYGAAQREKQAEYRKAAAKH